MENWWQKIFTHTENIQRSTKGNKLLYYSTAGKGVKSIERWVESGINRFHFQAFHAEIF